MLQTNQDRTKSHNYFLDLWRHKGWIIATNVLGLLAGGVFLLRYAPPLGISEHAFISLVLVLAIATGTSLALIRARFLGQNRTQQKHPCSGESPKERLCLPPDVRAALKASTTRPLPPAAYHTARVEAHSKRLSAYLKNRPQEKTEPTNAQDPINPGEAEIAEKVSPLSGAMRSLLAKSQDPATRYLLIEKARAPHKACSLQENAFETHLHGKPSYPDHLIHVQHFEHEIIGRGGSIFGSRMSADLERLITEVDDEVAFQSPSRTFAER